MLFSLPCAASTNCCRRASRRRPRLPTVAAAGANSQERTLERFRRLGSAIWWAARASGKEASILRGRALSLVIIDKLPSRHGRPTVGASAYEPQCRFALEPPVAARSDQHQSRAPGALIRDETDRGVLMICDPRLITKPYGKRVWRSLPPCGGRVLEECWISSGRSAGVSEDDPVARRLQPQPQLPVSLVSDCACVALTMGGGESSRPRRRVDAARPQLFSDSVVFVGRRHLRRMAGRSSCHRSRVVLPCRRLAGRRCSWSAVARQPCAAARRFLSRLPCRRQWASSSRSTPTPAAACQCRAGVGRRGLLRGGLRRLGDAIAAPSCRTMSCHVPRGWRWRKGQSR